MSGSAASRHQTDGIAAGDSGLLSIEAARERLARGVVPVTAIERVALRSALGRVLAQDLLSPIDVPAHDNAAMDGWALRSIDLRGGSETRLRPIGTALAGIPFEGTPGPGEAVRVMTGAVMPVACDTVVVQEAAWVDGAQVVIPPGQQPGQNWRRRGEDLAAGSTALPAGRLIRPAELGLLASLGLGELPVYRRLRVAFFSTGNELRSIGEALDPGCLYDSNRYTLFGLLQRLGVDPIDMGVVPDTPEALEQAIGSASRNADAIVSSGGVSVGDADFTRAAMARLGEVAFHDLAIRPGRPFAFGRIGRAAYYGLPGNPVAAMLTFLLLVRDALIRQSGATPRPVLPVRARSGTSLRKRPGRTEYPRAHLALAADGVLEARVIGNQGSAALHSMSEANAVLVLAPDQGEVAAGEFVDAIPFEGLL